MSRRKVREAKRLLLDELADQLEGVGSTSEERAAAAQLAGEFRCRAGARLPEDPRQLTLV